MSNQKKINNQLVKLKFNAYKLKESGCISTFLFKKICSLGVDTTLEQVIFVKDLTYKCMRLNGFYHRFPEESKAIDDEIKKQFEERGM